MERVKISYTAVQAILNCIENEARREKGDPKMARRCATTAIVLLEKQKAVNIDYRK